jgi:hypothetical protein
MWVREDTKCFREWKKKEEKSQKEKGSEGKNLRPESWIWEEKEKYLGFRGSQKKNMGIVKWNCDVKVGIWEVWNPVGDVKKEIVIMAKKLGIVFLRRKCKIFIEWK